MPLGYMTRDKFVTLTILGILSQTKKTEYSNKLPIKCNFVRGYVWGYISKSFELWSKPILKEDEKFEYSFEVVVPFVLLNIFNPDEMHYLLDINSSPEKYESFCSQHKSYEEGVHKGAEEAYGAWVENKTPTKMADGFLIPHSNLIVDKNCYENIVNKDNESFELIENASEEEDIFKIHMNKIKQETIDYYDNLKEDLEFS